MARLSRPVCMASLSSYLWLCFSMASWSRPGCKLLMALLQYGKFVKTVLPASYGFASVWQVCQASYGLASVCKFVKMGLPATYCLASVWQVCQDRAASFLWLSFRVASSRQHCKLLMDWLQYGQFVKAVLPASYCFASKWQILNKFFLTAQCQSLSMSESLH